MSGRVPLSPALNRSAGVRIVVPATGRLRSAVDVDGLAGDVQRARSEARKTAAPAMSSTSPSRPSGTACLSSGRIPSGECLQPLGDDDVGAIALTRMPWRASSNAAAARV